MRTILLFFFVFISTTLQCNAQTGGLNDNKWTLSDSLAFKRIGRVVSSPDGKQVLFNVMQIVSAHPGKQWKSTLYIKNNLGKVRRLMSTSNDISSPRWSPNGKWIAYLGKGKKHQSIWIRRTNGANPIKLIELDRDISAFKWSNTGASIAYVASSAVVKKSKPPKLIDVAKSYINTRLYIISTKVHPNRKNKARALTPNKFSISIFDPYYGGGFDWSPDSKSIVFAYQPRPGASYSNQSKLAFVNIKTGKIVDIPYTRTHPSNQPLFSPDGKWVAFRSNLPATKTATMLNNDIALNNRICVADTTTLKIHCLKNTFDENPIIVGWNSASNNVIVFDSFKTIMTQLYGLNIDPNEDILELSNVRGFINPLSLSINRNHTVFGFAYETPTQPPEPYTSPVQPFKLNQITQIQKQIKSPIAKMKVIHWRSTDGKQIEGLLITPQDIKTGKKYPLVVAVHGGPTGTWTKRYVGGCWGLGKTIIPICWSDLVSQGFVVFQPNPRGSGGYGLSFRLANFKDFGGGDYQDIMSGVDHLIKQGIVDSNHLAIFGWSYGGYLTAWAVTQTHSFKAAVDGAGLTDFISFAGTSDIPGYLEQFLGQPYWKNSKLYLQRAPIMHVANITTPLLIMDGEKDIRVPVTQSQELYTTLKRQNKTVKWLLLPKQGHAPMDPNLITAAIKQSELWLDKALK